jgi:hypothetical protein
MKPFEKSRRDLMFIGPAILHILSEAPSGAAYDVPPLTGLAYAGAHSGYKHFALTER